MSKIVKIKKIDGVYKPATEEDREKVEKLLNEIYEVWPEDYISVYVGVVCNSGGLEFKIDINKDVPDKVYDVLDKYQPVKFINGEDNFNIKTLIKSSKFDLYLCFIDNDDVIYVLVKLEINKVYEIKNNYPKKLYPAIITGNYDIIYKWDREIYPNTFFGVDLS